MLRWSLLFSFLFLIFYHSSFSQVVEMIPADATVDSTVTIYFDATEGNQGLMNYDSAVYAHTGVITLQSSSNSDWKHVVANWGTEDDKVRMQRVGDNLYSLSFHIKSYYNIQPNETVLKLAFVFRNADGSLSGRAENGTDIFIPLENESQWQYERFINTSEGLNIFTSKGIIQFRPYFSGVISTEFIPDSSISQDSYGIVEQPSNVSFSVDTTETKINAKYNDFSISINKDPVRLLYSRKDSLIQLESFFVDKSGGILTFAVDSQTNFYGGGSRALPMDLSGHHLEFYNQAHYGYGNNTPNLNISIPVITTSKQYSLIFDNHYRSSLDLRNSQNNEITYQTSHGPFRYFILSKDSTSQLSGSIAKLTGHAPLPSIWSLGYIQSRYGYQNREEAEEVVSQMQNNNFPMDALVLDLYWFGGVSHMGDFSWDLNHFPEPGSMISNFKEKGIETIVITEPYFTLESELYELAASNEHFATNQNDEPYVLQGFWAGDASLLDMSSQSARDWLWPHYQDLFEMGVSGLWTDLGEPESHPGDMQHKMGSAEEVHNLYNNFWSKMLHEKTTNKSPDKRLFNLTRSGYLGMQRYSTYPWSGDVQRSFSGLQAQIPIMLHMGLSGVGYMHSDLGGFTGGQKNPELYTRWMQLGVFSPVMRAHGTGIPTEPIYYDEQTQSLVRDAIKMRYEFLPYNYTLAWNYSTTGEPLARPMNYYKTSQNLNSINDQYLWGKDLLVAPVITENTTERLVTLPEDTWADYYTGELVEGGVTITTNSPMETIPLFIRAGGFIVQSNEKLPNTKAYDSDSIKIRHVVPSDDKTSISFWYHDDGLTSGNLENKEFNLMKLESSRKDETTTISLKKTESNIESPKRDIEFMFYGLDKKPGNISLNNYNVPLYTENTSYNAMKKAAYWDEQFLHLHFPWKDSLVSVKINHEEVSGIKEKYIVNNIHLEARPNPFSIDTELEVFVNYSGTYRFTLYTVEGEILVRQERFMKSGGKRIHLSELYKNPEDLTNGVYLLTVEGKLHKLSKKIIKVSE